MAKADENQELLNLPEITGSRKNYHRRAEIDPEFVRTISAPDYEDLLLGNEILYDLLTGTERETEVEFEREEGARYMAVTGEKPPEIDLENPGPYSITQKTTPEDIQIILKEANNQEINLYHIEGVKEKMLEKGFEPEKVSEMMSEVEKYSEPIEVERVREEGPFYPGIAAEALEKGANIVTHDSIFLRENFKKKHLVLEEEMAMEEMASNSFTAEQIRMMLENKKLTS